MFKTKLFGIGMPIAFALIVFSGVIQIQTPSSLYSQSYHYETPDFLIVLAFFGVIWAISTIVVMINFKDKMAGLRANITTYHLVVDDYKNQLTKLTEDSNKLIKGAVADMGTHIPTGQLVEQVGVLHVKIADAEAVISKAKVTYQEWKSGVCGYIATYYWDILINEEDSYT